MSAPAVIPAVTVEMDGLRLAEADVRSMGEVRVYQALSLPTVCELAFYEPEGAVVGAVAVGPGTALRIRVEGLDPFLFEGELTAVEYDYGPGGERRVYMRGYDMLHRLRKRQPVRSHVQVNFVELARTLVSDLGFSVSTVDPGPVWQELFQYGQSDLDLLAEIGERCGQYFTLRGSALHLTTLDGFGTALPLELGVALMEARVEINAETACRIVEARGWDPHRATPVVGSASRARIGRNVPAAVFPEQVGGLPRRTLVDTPVQEDLHAEGIAQAELDRRAAREVVFRGIAEGDARLRPGTPVDVSGVAPHLAGRYVLTAVRHIIDRRKGYVSELDTSPPPGRFRARGTSATLGVVSRVDDPEGMGRVRVVLPNYGDVEAGWFNVVSPGAGPGKGIMALPDVNDRVLVVLINGDPAQGVVIGGLYSLSAPPDTGVSDGTVRRFNIMTPGGLRVRLDDETKTVDIETGEGDRIAMSPEEILMADSRGSHITLSAGKCRIVSTADLDISAPGRKVTISGNHIDFERS